MVKISRDFRVHYSHIGLIIDSSNILFCLRNKSHEYNYWVFLFLSIGKNAFVCNEKSMKTSVTGRALTEINEAIRILQDVAKEPFCVYIIKIPFCLLLNILGSS